MLDERHWQANREASYDTLQQPYQDAVKSVLTLQFHQAVGKAEKSAFAGIPVFSQKVS